MAPARRHALLVLAFAVLTTAQLTGLPSLTTDNEVLGATTAPASSAKSATSGSATAGSTSTPTSAPTSAPASKSTTSNNAATSVSSAVGGFLTNAPTLYGVGIPPLIVPDTSNAPFMQKSNLPEGFVFICVGAILAFLGFSVILWRAIVAWSLHRSVKRAASDRYLSEKKSMFGAPTDYSSYAPTSMSMENLSKDSYHRSEQRLSKTPNIPTRQSRDPSSLFFSPTAGSAQRSSRASSYLPSGYYASGSATLGSGSGFTNLGGAPAGYGRVGEAFSDSPPPSRPQSRYLYDDNPSRERLSPLDVPVPDREHRRSPSGLRTSTEMVAAGELRAPSAVLDDLFDHHTSMR